MTMKSHIRPTSRTALRSGTGYAVYAYYYGYFTAGAETV
jgi:hypothetical protein